MSRRARSLLWSGIAVSWLIAMVLAAGPALAQDSTSEVHIAPRVSPDAPKVANNDPALKPTGRPFKSEVELVLVPVMVTDPDDRLVTGLEKHNFEIYQDKEQQVIQHLSTDDAPISLGIIFDMSGSMADKLDNARQAVVEFLKTANPEDEFFIIGFSNKPELISDFTTSINDIQSKMVFTQAKGMTALLDGIYMGLHQMTRARNTRRALLIISDGGDNHSRYTEREVKNLVEEADVQIYAIGLFEGAPPTTEEVHGPELLKDVTEATGGRVFMISNPAELTDAATKIGIQLRDEYVIGYHPKTKTKDGKFHKIRVKLIPPKGLPPLRVTAKKGFYAPSE